MLFVLVVLFSTLLLAEFLAAATHLLVARSVNRFTGLTGLGRRAAYVFGAIDVVGSATVILGFSVAAFSYVGAGIFAAVCLFVLGRQVRRGQRGRALAPYSVYLSWAVLLVAFRVLA
jgi:hypothetical protein